MLVIKRRAERGRTGFALPSTTGLRSAELQFLTLRVKVSQLVSVHLPSQTSHAGKTSDPKNTVHSHSFPIEFNCFNIALTENFTNSDT